jgi:Uma2 family endonuclease
MAFTVGEREVRPLTADEVLRMVELGILDEDEPVELLHGALVRVSAKTPAHENVKLRLGRWLGAGQSAGLFDVRVESPIHVPDRTSLPEPDYTIVPWSDEWSPHPTSALLVIEVAVSSLRTDTRVKPTLFAAAGVPEMWVVEPERRRVHVFDGPKPDGYERMRVVEEDGVLRPQLVHAPPLVLAGLFERR